MCVNKDDNDRVNMAFAGLTLSEFMQNALVHEESCAVGANKNLCGNKLREMTAYPQSDQKYNECGSIIVDYLRKI